MGTLTALNLNNLFWLGRYTERVFTTLNIFFSYVDKMVDRDNDAYKKYLVKMNLPDIYTDEKDFIRRYVFDLSDCNSIASNLDYALGNGIVLRDEIKTPSLSYLQMCADKLKAAAGTDKLRYDLLPVRDNIYAFWGCVDDNMTNEEALRMIHLGKAVERIDMFLRMGYPVDVTDTELKNLSKHLLRYNVGNYSFINKEAYSYICNVRISEDIYPEILENVENLIEVNIA